MAEVGRRRGWAAPYLKASRRPFSAARFGVTGVIRNRVYMTVIGEVYIRFLVNIGECIHWVSFWGYQKYSVSLTIDHCVLANRA